MSATGMPLDGIAAALANYAVNRAVINRTGLDGVFDVELRFAPEGVASPQRAGTTTRRRLRFGIVEGNLGRADSVCRLVAHEHPDKVSISFLSFPRRADLAEDSAVGTLTRSIHN